MKIAICGSMHFASKMLEVETQLKTLGHQCYLPGGTEATARYTDDSYRQEVFREHAQDKIANDWIRHHYRLIRESDAVLILNYSKGEHKNYIGANSFLEMGYAHALGKPIYLLLDLPDMAYHRDEILAMQPIALLGNLSAIGAPAGYTLGSCDEKRRALKR